MSDLLGARVGIQARPGFKPAGLRRAGSPATGIGSGNMGCPEAARNVSIAITMATIDSNST